ncbi:TolC family protein [Ferrimonas balearica]|uniref:TolC family protein n=1 Tax=Ferrimonas balearica TaxID=44012 RepID=UPI001C99DB5D|nr:TolC family protein [Ferrimonas balearica]MBY5923359.1 TolC family protein [Ferrimonas balearica]MBY5995317.1 TolC family protein [Ferrimonas balearica]
MHNPIRAVVLVMGLTLPTLAAATGMTPQASKQVLEQLDNLPLIQMEAARLKQQQLAVETANQALYNPELGLDAENLGSDESDIEYTLSLSQGYDRGDKRGLQRREADLAAQIALAEYGLLRNQQLAELLTAWVELDLAQRLDHFTSQAQQRTEAMLTLAQRMVAVGEIAPLDQQLLQLELARLTGDRLASQQSVIQALANLRQMGGEALVTLASATPLSLDSPTPQATQRVALLPALKPAYLEVKRARAAYALRQQQSKADPSFSLGAKTDGQDQSLALGVAIPLNLRNRYQGEVAEANQAIVVAEQAYFNAERNLTIELDALRQALNLLQQGQRQWQNLASEPLRESQSLLERQWRGGEIATANYLQSQQQLTDTQASGAELEAAQYRAWLALMAARGELESWLSQRAQITPIEG